MIAYIRGVLAMAEEDKVIIDVGGVGYGVFMTGPAISRLGAKGTEVVIHTFLNVKEDAMQLYGFRTRDELFVFRLLIGVNGIGPKAALGILSVLSPDDLRLAVAAGDVKAITAAPGIGKKTAEKLILELKDRLRLEEVLDSDRQETDRFDQSGGMPEEMKSDAVQALTALGYGASEALKAVRQVEAYEGMTTEELLKQALKHMTF